MASKEIVPWVGSPPNKPAARSPPAPPSRTGPAAMTRVLIADDHRMRAGLAAAGTPPVQGHADAAKLPMARTLALIDPRYSAPALIDR